MMTPQIQITLKDPMQGLMPGDLVAGTVELPGPIKTFILIGNKLGIVNTKELPINKRTSRNVLIFRVESCSKKDTHPKLTLQKLGISDEERDHLLAEWQEQKKVKTINRINKSNDDVVLKPNKLTIPIKSAFDPLSIGDFVIGYVIGNQYYGVFVEVGERKGLIHVNYLPEYDSPRDFKKDQPLLLKIIGIKDDGKLALDLKNVPEDQFKLAVSDLQNINYQKVPVDEKLYQLPTKLSDVETLVNDLSGNDYCVKHNNHIIIDPFKIKPSIGNCVVGIVTGTATYGVDVCVGDEEYFIEVSFLRTEKEPIFDFVVGQPILLQCTAITPRKKYYFSQKTIQKDDFISIVQFLKKSGVLRKAIITYKNSGIKAKLTLISRISQDIRKTVNLSHSVYALTNDDNEGQCKAIESSSIQPIEKVSIEPIETPVCNSIQQENSHQSLKPCQASSQSSPTNTSLPQLLNPGETLAEGCYVLGKVKKHSWYGLEVEFGTNEGVIFANSKSELKDYPDNSYILLRYIEKTESGKNIFLLSDSDIPERQVLEKLEQKSINVLFVGPTGVGKSSLINAMLCMGMNNLIDFTTVGHGFNTCTNEIKPYHYKKLTLWDSPGLGESSQNDIKTLNLINQWIEANTGKPIVLVVAYDAYSRDCHSTFSVLDNLKNKLPTLHVINRVDMLLRGQYWDDNNSCPKKETNRAIREKILSIKQRIGSITSNNEKVIAVCAGFNNEFADRRSYNIEQFINEISSLTKV